MGKPIIGLIFKFGEAHLKDKQYLEELKEVRGCQNLAIQVIDWRYQPENEQAFFKDMPLSHVEYCANEFLKERKSDPSCIPTELREEANSYYQYTTGKTLAQAVDDYLETVDAIYIPGGAFDPKAEYCLDDPKKPPIDNRREEFERALVKKAIERGIPVLGICAGSWLVATCYEGVKTAALQDEVHDLHRQDKPLSARSVIGDKADVGEEETIPGLRGIAHKAVIKEETMLHQIVSKAKGWRLKSPHGKALFWENPMTKMEEEGDILMGVNSTHWRVVVAQNKEGRIDNESLLVISAIEPEHNTIEAFESRFGVPIMGIQFHPEYRVPVWITKKAIVPDWEYPANRRILEGFLETALTHANKKELMREIDTEENKVKTSHPKNK